MKEKNDLLLKKEINKLKKIIESQENEIFQLQFILSSVPGHLYWTDKNNIFLGCNAEQARSAGLCSSEDLIGKSNYDTPWKDQADKLNELNNKVISTGETFITEEAAQTIEGLKLYQSKKTPFYNNQGEVIGVIGTSIDITDLKKTQEELSKQIEIAKKAIKSKTEFLEVMSHDLRGPFNNILGASEIAKMYLTNNKTKEEIEEFLNIIPSEINRALDLLNNVILLLELNEGKLKTEIISINLKEMIRMILSYHESSSFIKTHVDIAVNVPEKILIDAMNLFLALRIVINNAFRFTQKGSVAIKITLTEGKDNCIDVNVTDTGCGMSSEQQANLFKAFIEEEETAECSHLRKPGLKLVIAKKIIELLEGTFFIDSKDKVGTYVRLSIPFKPDGTARRTEPVLLSNTQYNRQAIDIPCFSILLVEDDLLSIELESVALESLNQKVTKATTGRQAIELAKATKFDIIFLDITLPDINGVEVATQIRQVWGDDITIVAVTSHTLEKDITLFIRHGMMTIIPKPANHNSFKEFLIDYAHALRDLDD